MTISLLGLRRCLFRRHVLIGLMDLLLLFCSVVQSVCPRICPLVVVNAACLLDLATVLSGWMAFWDLRCLDLFWVKYELRASQPY